MQRRRADPLACLAALVVIVASGYALVGAVAAEPWVRYALRLETATEPVALSDTLRMRLADELARGTGVSCDFDLPEGYVTVAMDLLRRSLADGPDARAEAERVARKTVGNALGCNAADGNLWYLLALLDDRAGADRGRIRELVLLSAALSPYEADTLAKRGLFVAWQLSRNRIAPPLDVQADLRRAVATAKVEPAAQILASLRSSGHEALADDLVAELPEERLEALQSGTSWRRSTFGRADSYRRFEYRPFGDSDR